MTGFSAGRRRVWLFGAAVAATIGTSTVATAQTVASAPIEQVRTAWTIEAAHDLEKAVEASRREGLNPDDYGLARLAAAIDVGQGAALDGAAYASALALAHDYAFGRVGDREAMDWYIANGADLNGLATGLQQALAAGKPRAFLEGLLPTDRRYVALRDALADASDLATRDRLRANMERWRWMPRDLGQDYLYVNVPSYQLKVMSGGETVSTYTVIVGAKDTPTPQLAGPASSLVVNPWWNVPASIVKSARLRPGRGGYVFKRNADGSLSVRQPPGARNSLGRIKINLVNDQAIYLHDTPAKGAFGRDERALSHGCIRVKDIDQLAAELMNPDTEDGQLDTALASDRTATLTLGRTWQVYLVYFTADVDDTGQVVTLADPYGRDAPLIAALGGDARPLGSQQMAAR